MDHGDEVGEFAEDLRRDEILDDLDRLLVRAKDVSFGAGSARTCWVLDADGADERFEGACEPPRVS